MCSEVTMLADCRLGLYAGTLDIKPIMWAEYEALRRGVLMAVGLGIENLTISGDSRLCVKQV